MYLQGNIGFLKNPVFKSALIFLKEERGKSSQESQVFSRHNMAIVPMQSIGATGAYIKKAGLRMISHIHAGG
jgi:hypothetical protein